MEYDWNRWFGDIAGSGQVPLNINAYAVHASNASDNLPRPVEVTEPIHIRGIVGETIILTRFDTGAVLEIDDGLVCADAHLCIDRLRELVAAGQRVIAEIEARAGTTKVIEIKRVPPAPGSAR